MKQIICKVGYNAGFGGAIQYVDLAGEGTISDSSTFGINHSRIVVPIAGTFRNLALLLHGTHPDCTVTLMVNGIATLLETQVLSGATTNSNTIVAIDVVAGDDVTMRVISSATGAGYDVGFSLEFEAAAHFYGLVFGFGGGTPVGTVRAGGGLGNGVDAVGPSPLSNTYSINAVQGTITMLAMKTFLSEPAGDSWTADVKKNTVRQDGTGGTVDTRCVLIGPATSATASFALPLAITDHVDIEVERTGSTGAPFTTNFSAAVAFVPTDSNSFMLVGGNNAVVDAASVGWRWKASEQLAALEANHVAPVGPRGFTALGLYIETGEPDAGRSVDFVLRRSGTDTGIAFTIANVATSGSDVGNEPYVSGDTITIQYTPVNTPTFNSVHWGLALQAAGVSAPVRYTRRWLRRSPVVSG